MAGVLDREKIAQSAGGGRKWSGLSIARKGFLEPADGFAMVSYEATAGRADGTPYKALVSSGYARHGQEWKLAFHQQTPLTPGCPALRQPTALWNVVRLPDAGP